MPTSPSERPRASTRPPISAALQQRLHGPTQFRVECRQRFVEQQHAWRRGQRPGQCQTLLLAAGEFRWVAFGELFQADQGQQFVGRWRRLLRPAGEIDLATGVHVREQCMLLENQADLAPTGRHLLARFGVQPDFIAKADVPGERAVETGEQAQQGRLAGAGWALQREPLAGRQAELDIEQRFAGSEGQRFAQAEREQRRCRFRAAAHHRQRLPVSRSHPGNCRGAC